jgi:hypothetical protein
MTERSQDKVIVHGAIQREGKRKKGKKEKKGNGKEKVLLLLSKLMD